MFQFFKYILVVLVLFFLTACGDSESDYDRGLRIGKNIGYDNGYYNGIDTGEKRGYRKGFSEGNETGFKEGELTGFTKGFFEGNRTGDYIGHLRGYNEGYIDGDKNRNYRIIRESSLPMFAIIVLMFFMILFIMYFRKILIEKLKALVYYLYNLYMILDFEEKSYIQENHQNEINNLKAEIFVHNLSIELQENNLYNELTLDMFEIKNKIKMFIYEKQFNVHNNIKVNYQDIIKKINNDKHLLSKEKYFLFKEIRESFFKEYLKDISENITIQKISNDDFYRITNKDILDYKENLDFLNTVKPIIEEKSITREKLLYILLTILDISIIGIMLYSIIEMYLQ